MHLKLPIIVYSTFLCCNCGMDVAEAAFVPYNVNDQILDFTQHIIFFRRWSDGSYFVVPFQSGGRLLAFYSPVGASLRG